LGVGSPEEQKKHLRCLKSRRKYQPAQKKRHKYLNPQDGMIKKSTAPSGYNGCITGGAAICLHIHLGGG